MRTTKTYSIKVLRPPIIDGALQMPAWGRTPSSVPRAAGHPFWATAKMQKKRGWYWCSTGLYFVDQASQKLRPLSATIQENGKFTFLFILEVCFFSFFFAYFSSFFTLIRATLGFLVFPNKSYTLIRATLGFGFFLTCVLIC